ncbi:MAG: anaerobic glycerol-3-phosphate dehydrogenase subunit GlpA [Myxococcota bacterium]|mgnify:FL=1|nr:anaerobic glycerol-3-phosphate dehydrogenase subunit A [Myxococcota bacterium]MBP8971272.1 anaerobic glycerol-3-phosphate dehydrogenase subunit A [Myxococcota bacterium]
METQVLIIGGGATGTSIMRDLALRGVDCILVEQDDLNAGASGRNHGLLHSGARYVSNDHDAAVECRIEGDILKRLAGQTIQATGGYFVAVQGDDENFIADFPGHCDRAGISWKKIDLNEAFANEPAISRKAIAVYEVPDASIDPFRLSLESVAHAKALGCRLLRRSQVVAFKREGNRITSTTVRDRVTGEEREIVADQIINAAGAWAKIVAGLANIHIDMLYSKGTLLITHNRLAHRAINRLRKPSNADILMPGGTVSIIGTTSVKIDNLDDVYPSIAEVDQIVEESSAMVPDLATVRYIRAYAGVRPLVGASGGDGRSVSRGFALLGHEESGLENFATITGGKLTTCRLMAEKAADLVCERLGVTTPCVTASVPLPSAYEGRWTEPGHAPKAWMRSANEDDPLICECEMVSGAVIRNLYNQLVKAGDNPTFTDIGLRSRVGKGACQGAFCAVRAAAHLYQHGAFQGRKGLDQIVDFFDERWGGQHGVLWGEQLAQAELMEALHCGLFGEELK